MKPGVFGNQERPKEHALGEREERTTIFFSLFCLNAEFRFRKRVIPVSVWVGRV